MNIINTTTIDLKATFNVFMLNSMVSFLKWNHVASIKIVGKRCITDFLKVFH